ncbi:MAG: hypothetical protein EBU84_00255 [Actinobacteria bacterium]|nr:hypothetical protein [Actinomycetota bacterium]
MLVKRIWKKAGETAKTKGDGLYLNVWDGGSVRYERLSDGTERSWKILEREATSTGFTETLLELPAYVTPTELVWKEEVPVFRLPNGTLQIPGWTIQEMKSKGDSGNLNR